MENFLFELVTPEKVQFSGTAEMVTAPGTDGEFGVLAGHAPFVSTLKAGVITIQADGATRKLAVAAGLAEVTPTQCIILAEKAADLSGLTADEAQKRLQAARDAVEVAATEDARRSAESALALAEVMASAL